MGLQPSIAISVSRTVTDSATAFHTAFSATPPRITVVFDTFTRYEKRFSPLELVRIFAGGGERVAKNILVYARLPRTFAALASGAALSVSGAVLQNVLDNKLASPGIIGVNAGAGLGVTLCIAAGITIKTHKKIPPNKKKRKCHLPGILHFPI